MKRIDRQTVVRLLLLLTVVWSVGCGRKGPPLPPEPRGPNPPQRVDARQIGERGYVTLQLGEPRGTKPNQAMQSIELIRVSYEGATPPPVDPDAFRRRGELVASREATTAWESGRVELLVDPTSSAPAD